MPAAMISDTAAPAASVESNAARIVRTASGTRRILSVTFVTTASVPFGSDERAHQVQARRIERGAAKVHDLTIGQHGLDARARGAR